MGGKERNSPALYRLIKTTSNNIIIREDGTKRVAVLRGKDRKLFIDRKIENKGLCLKLSEKLPGVWKAGTFEDMLAEAQKMLDTEEDTP